MFKETTPGASLELLVGAEGCSRLLLSDLPPAVTSHHVASLSRSGAGSSIKTPIYTEIIAGVHRSLHKQHYSHEPVGSTEMRLATHFQRGAGGAGALSTEEWIRWGEADGASRAPQCSPGPGGFPTRGARGEHRQMILTFF